MHRSLKLPRGVRRHGAGWQARVSVAGAGRAVAQFDLATSFETMADWQEDERYRLRKELRTRNPLAGATRGSFAEDVTTYLAAIAAMPDLARRTKDLYLWVAEFGTRRRATITATDIRTVRDRWLTVGPKMMYRKKTPDTPAHWEAVAIPLAGSTVNHRLRALSNVWTVLDGRRAPNPVREVPEADEAPQLPRALPYDAIARALAALPDRGRGTRHEKRPTVSLTKLRLAVMMWTGLPQKGLAALTPAHIDLEAGTLLTTARRKGAGVGPALLPLLPQAVDALRAFAAADAWGSFSTSSMRTSWRLAAKKADLPTGTRPYDLRHSYGTAVFLASGSLEAAGGLLQHADARTTRRYGLAAVRPVLAAALARWPHTPPAGPVAGPGPSDEGGKQAENRGRARSKTVTRKGRNRRK